ncbi:hypothetical protein [Mycolicibacterium fortuitum]|uniref:hypothetical protein n=1 Tax=Mycolicibacterium fortuitum TaxID=1766 RepID=UPI0007E9DBA6|nr:hypothetical protein [Mycolicibacterium fortuitum]OBF77024.1 hypothetical protein A5751_22855 [Mycolicibacterium fortuitum]
MITISTGSLVGLLSDAIQTADRSGKLDIGVHLATHRDEYGDEPGQYDLLAATSTDRFVIGHGFVPVEGQLMTSVWPVDQTQMVIKVCENLLKSHGKDHTVDVEVVQMLPSGDDEEHPRFTVTLRETPALFDAETEYQFTANSEYGFPLKAAWKALNGKNFDSKHRESVETIWSPRVMAAITAVAKRKKESMYWYRQEGTLIRRVQIGNNWIGAANPIKQGLGEAGAAPSIDPLLPRPEGVVDDQPLSGEFVDDGPLAIDHPPLELEAGDSNIIDAEVIEDDEPDASDPDFEADDELDADADDSDAESDGGEE